MTYCSGVGLLNCDLLYSGVKRLPQPGEEVYADGFDMQLGGGLPATLIHLARLGVPADFATFLGEGRISGFIRGLLKEEGARYTNLYEGNGEPVTVTSVLILPENRSFVSRCEKIEYTKTMQDRLYRQLSGASVVRMGYEMPEMYARLKREHPDVTLVLDDSWRDDLSLEVCEPFLRVADVFTPNDQEAMKLTATDSPEAALDVLANYFDCAIVKLGGKGCLLKQNGEITIIPTIPLDKPAVDSTGAGDAFVAGVMYGLFHGRSMPDCVRLGSIMGGTCVQEIGCLTAHMTEPKLWQIAEAVYGMKR